MFVWWLIQQAEVQDKACVMFIGMIKKSRKTNVAPDVLCCRLPYDCIDLRSESEPTIFCSTDAKPRPKKYKFST